MHARSVDILFGTRQSKAQYVDQRSALYMESKKDAVARTEKRKLDEESGKFRKRRHCTNFEEVEFDKAAMLEEVRGMKGQKEVNRYQCPNVTHISENNFWRRLRKVKFFLAS
uniref:Uncharacterized protein n=1 Tax=Clytia hemisphaerica TaxID=252671 RepID=A0A7M5TTV1_9CNID